MMQETIGGYRKSELELIVRQRRAQLTAKITELRGRMRKMAAELDEAEKELAGLDQAEILLED